MRVAVTVVSAAAGARADVVIDAAPGTLVGQVTAELDRMLHRAQAAAQELYSGKHKTTGKNVQVGCDLYGELAWISDPVDGSRHDAHCIDESSVLTGFPGRSQIGDKGYVGKGMITPIRKPECRELLNWEKEFNTQ